MHASHVCKDSENELAESRSAPTRVSKTQNVLHILPEGEDDVPTMKKKNHWIPHCTICRTNYSSKLGRYCNPWGISKHTCRVEECGKSMCNNCTVRVKYIVPLQPTETVLLCKNCAIDGQQVIGVGRRVTGVISDGWIVKK